MDGLFKFGIVVWVLGVILNFSLLAGAIWVIYHFVSKYW